MRAHPSIRRVVRALAPQILLMSQGRVVFSGPMSSLAAYFTSSDLGYEIPDGCNIADFALKVSGAAVSPEGHSLARSAEELELCFKHSDAAVELDRRSQAAAAEARGLLPLGAGPGSRGPISGVDAALVLAGRTLKETSRGVRASSCMHSCVLVRTCI